MSIDGISNHAYLSDEELMVWMQEKTGGLYDNLTDAMDISDRRSGLVEDLTNLKTRIKNATAEQSAQLAQDARSMLAKAEGTPGYEELQATLQPMIDALDQYVAFVAWAQANGFDVSALGAKPITQDIRDAWADNIQARVDALGREDQLNLIRIGSLDKQIGQAEQITSNLIKSRNDARSAIISNMRA